MILPHASAGSARRSDERGRAKVPVINSDPHAHTAEELTFPMAAKLVAMNAEARARRISKRSQPRRASR